MRGGLWQTEPEDATASVSPAGPAGTWASRHRRLPRRCSRYLSGDAAEEPGLTAPLTATSAARAEWTATHQRVCPAAPKLPWPPHCHNLSSVTWVYVAVPLKRKTSNPLPKSPTVQTVRELSQTTVCHTLQSTLQARASLLSLRGRLNLKLELRTGKEKAVTPWVSAEVANGKGDLVQHVLPQESAPLGNPGAAKPGASELMGCLAQLVP